MKKAGIYKITCTINNKIYVGQSVDVHGRLRVHKRQLLKGNHQNTYLQRCFSKYGLNSFTFEIITYCNVDELDDLERYWITFYDSMNSEKGFNHESGGSKGKVYSKERIKAISGEGNPMYGRKLSDEHKETIRISNYGSSDKLTKEDVQKIKEALLNGISQKTLAEMFNVKVVTINKIFKCHNWTWVSPELNDKLNKLIENNKRERDIKIIELNKEGLFNSEIADLLNTTMRNVKSVLEVNGLSSPNKGKIEENQIHRIIELKRKGYKNIQIAEKLGIGKNSVVKYIKDSGLEGVKRGSSQHNAKLTEKDVINIKSLLDNNISALEISKNYGVSRTTISDIKYKRTWNHVL